VLLGKLSLEDRHDDSSLVLNLVEGLTRSLRLFQRVVVISSDDLTIDDQVHVTVDSSLVSVTEVGELVHVVVMTM
jgi:hypothetical protein